MIGEPCTSVFDANMGRMIGTRLLKIIAWYDNEYGYSLKILELAKLMAEKDAEASK